MKKILFLGRRLLLAPFILYLFNVLASGLNLMIPINIVTLLVVAFLGFPGLISLILLMYFVF